MKYDKTGAAFEVDHEIDGVAFVRPMLKVIYQSRSYSGDDFHEETDMEPADFLVKRKLSELFDTPPIEVVDAEIGAKLEELAKITTEASRMEKQTRAEIGRLDQELASAKNELDRWFSEHRVMCELGKLLDGQILYPLSVRENVYHHAREIPRVPEMLNAKYLAVTSGDFEKGQKWVCKQYGSDSYGSPFRFFDTEEERAAMISEEFDATCEHFRKNPNLDTTSHTAGTKLHYGTLQGWVEAHPGLSIPEDIQAMKSEHDERMVEKRRAELAAELASMSGEDAA